MNLGPTILFVVLALTCVSANPMLADLVPDDQEVVYKYHATIKAGTHIPHLYASVFALEGKLRLQRDSKYTILCSFDDLTYTLHNGRESDYDLDDSVRLPIPDSLADLQKPFKLSCTETGKLDHITTEENEQDASLNIKKATAVTLQLDLDQMNTGADKPYAFISEEKTIFGKENVYYNIKPAGYVLTIEKMHESRTLGHLYENLMTNFRLDCCDEGFENPVSHDSQKTYTITNGPEGLKLSRVETNGGIYFQPYEGQSDAHYVFVNQTFNLIDLVPVQQKMKLSTHKKHDNFKYIITNDNLPFEQVADKQTLFPILEQMLGGIVEYVKHNHIHMTRPDFKQGQLINRICRLFLQFDLKMLEKMYDTLRLRTGERDILMLDVFQHLLPLIGTHSSLIFIRNLITESKLKEHIALNMLITMPFHVMDPSVQLIEDMEVLLNLTEKSRSMQKVALMSFTTLLHKLHEHKERRESHDHHESNILEKYITMFIKKLKAAQDYEQRCIYIIALHNIGTERIIEPLTPAIKGEWWNDESTRLTTMWGLYEVLSRDAEKSYELYWPIFTDRSLSADIRIFAFYHIMYSHPNLSRLINIFWYMQKEPNHDVYRFYYSFTKAMSEKTEPCFSELSLHAKQIVKYLPIPYLHGLTGFYASDFTNKKYKYGNAFHVTLIDTPQVRTFYFTISRFAMNMRSTPFEVYVKIKGLNATLLEKFKLNVLTNVKFFNYDEIIKSVKDIPLGDNIEIDFALIREKQVIEFIYFDSTHINIIKSYFKIWYENNFSLVKNYIHINYPVLMSTVIPTDIGFPVLYDLLLPSVHYSTINCVKKTENDVISIQIDSKFSTWAHGSYGLCFHNPIIQSWQGVKKYVSYDSVLPIYADITIDKPKSTLKLSWKRHEDVEKNIIGMNSHVTNMVYVKDYLHTGALEKSSPRSKHWVVVAHDDKFMHNHTFLSQNDPKTGLHMHFGIYDTDSVIYDQSLFKFWHENLFDFSGSPIDYYPTLLTHWHQRILLQPEAGTRGLMYKMKPCDKLGVTSVDLSLRVNQELEPEPPIYLPGMKVSVLATHEVKTKDETNNKWIFNGILDMNKGHTKNNLKIHFKKIETGQPDYNICLKGGEKYSAEGILGHLTGGISHTVDGKCSDNETVLEVTMTGKQYEEEKRSVNIYDSCHKNVWSVIHNIQPYSCYADHSSIRNYTFDFKTTNLPKTMQDRIHRFLNPIKIHYPYKYTFFDSHEEKIDENDFKILLEYPMTDDVLDIKVLTPHHAHSLTGVPSRDWAWLGVYPDNLHYPNMHRIAHKLGMTHVCTVDARQIINVKGDYLNDAVTEDWTLLMGSSVKYAEHGIWVKLVDNKLALKLIHKSQILKVLPQDSTFKVAEEGGDDTKEDWFHYDLHEGISHKKNVLVLLTKDLGCHIIYNGDQIQIEMPKSKIELTGKCFIDH